MATVCLFILRKFGLHREELRVHFYVHIPTGVRDGRGATLQLQVLNPLLLNSARRGIESGRPLARFFKVNALSTALRQPTYGLRAEIGTALNFSVELPYYLPKISS